MTLQESKDIRIKLHKEYYTEAALQSIGFSILANIDCEGTASVSVPNSQIILSLNTSEPSKLLLPYAVDTALNSFLQTNTPFQMIPNMYNILITHVGENNISTVVIML